MNSSTGFDSDTDIFTNCSSHESNVVIVLAIMVVVVLVVALLITLTGSTVDVIVIVLVLAVVTVGLVLKVVEVVSVDSKTLVLNSGPSPHMLAALIRIV